MRTSCFEYQKAPRCHGEFILVAGQGQMRDWPKFYDSCNLKQTAIFLEQRLASLLIKVLHSCSSILLLGQSIQIYI
jgi:hypothetical protein